MNPKPTKNYYQTFRMLKHTISSSVKWCFRREHTEYIKTLITISFYYNEHILLTREVARLYIGNEIKNTTKLLLMALLFKKKDNKYR